MSYKEKYLKYKNKYIELKNQLGGFLEGVTIVKTRSNTGRMEGMKNQCFWISILHFLNSNGYPNLSLRELRNNVGLDRFTERTMFDSFNNIFHNAATRAVEIYNLTITVYAVTSVGKVINGCATYGHGPNIVNIAMFGQGHFELIIEDGDTFVPAIIFKNELKKIDEIEYNIDDKMKQTYLELNENINYLTFYKIEFKDNITKMNKKTLDIINIMESELYGDTKNIFLKMEQDNFKKIKRINRLILNKIKKIEEDISSFKLIIKLYEDKLI
jgi:hypothetical protein